MDTAETPAPAKKQAKPKKKSVKKASTRKAVKRPKGKKKPAKRKAPAVMTTERLDIRLPKAFKAKLNAKAKRTRRTITSVVAELIERMR